MAVARPVTRLEGTEKVKGSSLTSPNPIPKECSLSSKRHCDGALQIHATQISRLFSSLSSFLYQMHDFLLPFTGLIVNFSSWYTVATLLLLHITEKQGRWRQPPLL
ncbi:MAG: hypothetical protein CL912_00815 [Deltaproteobacteria bacterium]|nr:hypothetical protein [Deltaproteobacteria bacterium]